MEIKYIIFWIIIAIVVIMIVMTWNRDLNPESEEKADFKLNPYPTKLNEWLIYVKNKNLSIDELRQLILDEENCNFDGVYSKLKGGYGAQKKAEYLFNQWNTPKKPKTKKN